MLRSVGPGAFGISGVSFAVLSYPPDTVFEELEDTARIEVSIVSAAAPRPETQEEILAAVLAARDERDIPAEDDSWVIVDSDRDRPAELAGLDGVELDELLSAAPSGLAGAAAGSGSAGGPGFAEGGVLDVLAPGVALAGCADDAHAGLAGLTDDELVGVLRAWARQESWAQARKLAAVAELARRRPAEDTPPASPGRFPASLSEFVAEEVALALTLTRCSAGAQLCLALELAARPAIAAALEAGQIDLPRTRVIIDGIAGLASGHAAAVEAAVLPEAPGMTSGQLRAAVARAVLAADPDAARRQREEDLKDARVECWTDPAGTANLAGRSLPCAETLAADQRLGQIARVWKKQLAAAWKQADPTGELPRPTAGADLLRARAYLALLLGQPVNTPPADLLPGPSLQPGDRHTGLPGPGAQPGDGHTALGDRVGSGGLRVPPGRRQPAPECGGSLPPLAGQVFLTLPLATLLGLSDAPGQAAGYGPVDPDTSRALARAAAGHPAAGWHLIITDPHGRAVGYGYAPRARPARARPARARPARGQLARGHPARGQPAPGHPADGWTITLTTERIAGGQSP
jgi:hypothetical protein